VSSSIAALVIGANAGAIWNDVDLRRTGEVLAF
jgi:hypothetical protein